MELAGTVSMCGVESECFKARRCSIGTIAGEGGTSSTVLAGIFNVPVFKLNWLGFRFMVAIFGLMNEGEAGSDAIFPAGIAGADGGWMESPFIFLGLRGDGDVMGRIKPPNWMGGVLTVAGDVTASDAIVGRFADKTPKEVAW